MGQYSTNKEIILGLPIVENQQRSEGSHIPTPPTILFPIILPGALARDACKAYRPVAANAPLPTILQVRQSCWELDCWSVGDEATGEADGE